MILPSKHIRNCESYIGLSSYLFKELQTPLTIDELWVRFDRVNGTVNFPTYHSFDNFILAIDLLYILNRVRLEEHKLLRNEIN